MFGDLLSNFQEKQEALKEKLAEITVEANAGDGAIKVTANCAREIINIKIDKTSLDWDDTEEVEDLVMEAVNRALLLAAEKEQEEAQNLVKDVMPPGLGNLGNLFG
ncbi:MAG: YbaB/EbfC family nucleoid-associated protein [Bacteroidetes bacterium]|jgi:DNA-binding YbaB/EbfC family protein|nr:YbaB/EbfC family nucleoid-associated protein [Bacteroidota bacterium]MDF1863818.1 YbaB/EbfC family nucleoid-associated protein [Saprospiraceae bacterium]